MHLAAAIAVGAVALAHIYFLILEMFLWDKPKGLATFGLTQEFATASKSPAMNQGLYNGFLAAGTFGGFTASRKILAVQALFGAIALVLVCLAN